LLHQLFGAGTPAAVADPPLPPLPGPPRGGGALAGGAASRRLAVRQQLAWLHAAFGAAAGLDACHGLDQAQALSLGPSSGSSAGPLELEEDSDAEEAHAEGAATPAAVAAAADAARAERLLDSLASAVSSGDDPAATLAVVWACAQCWCAHGCLATRAPFYAANLAPASAHAPTGVPVRVPASGTHDGLKEWLLAYFAALAAIGARQPLAPATGHRPPAAAVSTAAAAAANGLAGVDIHAASPDRGGSSTSGAGARAAAAPFSSGANCPGKHGLSTFKTTNNSWWCRWVRSNIYIYIVARPPPDHPANRD
jgi:hypothetical protein